MLFGLLGRAGLLGLLVVSEVWSFLCFWGFFHMDELFYLLRFRHAEWVLAGTEIQPVVGPSYFQGSIDEHILHGRASQGERC